MLSAIHVVHSHPTSGIPAWNRPKSNAKRIIGEALPVRSSPPEGLGEVVGMGLSPFPLGRGRGEATPLAMLTAKQSIASATDSSNMSQKLIMPAHLFFQHAKIQKIMETI